MTTSIFPHWISYINSVSWLWLWPLPAIWLRLAKIRILNVSSCCCNAKQRLLTVLHCTYIWFCHFTADHFSHVFIDECACTHETVSLIPIAGTSRLHFHIPNQLKASLTSFSNAYQLITTNRIVYDVQSSWIFNRPGGRSKATGRRNQIKCGGEMWLQNLVHGTVVQEKTIQKKSCDWQIQPHIHNATHSKLPFAFGHFTHPKHTVLWRQIASQSIIRY